MTHSCTYLRSHYCSDAPNMRCICQRPVRTHHDGSVSRPGLARQPARQREGTRHRHRDHRRHWVHGGSVGSTSDRLHQQQMGLVIRLLHAHFCRCSCYVGKYNFKCFVTQSLIRSSLMQQFLYIGPLRICFVLCITALLTALSVL